MGIPSARAPPERLAIVTDRGEIVEELIHQMRRRNVTFRRREAVESIEPDDGPPGRAVIGLESGNRLVSEAVLFSVGRSAKASATRPRSSRWRIAGGSATRRPAGLSYAPSATVLIGLDQVGDLSRGSLLAVADPDIPEATKEVEAIARLYPGRATVVAASVSKADLKVRAARHTILHLSVHGVFSAREPLLSYLKINSGGPDDGKLTAAEMFGLPLEQARLVVLSACETGRAEATHANEIVGMVRALLYAGADSLVLSHWKVDATSTALWMERFYREAQSKPPGEAARLALAAVRQDPRFAHPYHWAAFLLVGR